MRWAALRNRSARGEAKGDTGMPKSIRLMTLAACALTYAVMAAVLSIEIPLHMALVVAALSAWSLPIVIVALRPWPDLAGADYLEIFSAAHIAAVVVALNAAMAVTGELRLFTLCVMVALLVPTLAVVVLAARALFSPEELGTMRKSSAK
jgi:hypothetical protein